MAKKTKYISQDEISYIEHCLYNNIPYDIAPVNPFNEKGVERVLLKGEKYAQIDSPNFDHYVVTSLGRCINSRNSNVQKVRFTKTTVILYLDGVKVDIPGIFESQGWEYDFEKIYERYQKKKWKHFDKEYGREFS